MPLCGGKSKKEEKVGETAKGTKAEIKRNVEAPAIKSGKNTAKSAKEVPTVVESRKEIVEEVKKPAAPKAQPSAGKQHVEASQQIAASSASQPGFQAFSTYRSPVNADRMNGAMMRDFESKMHEHTNWSPGLWNRLLGEEDDYIKYYTNWGQHIWDFGDLDHPSLRPENQPTPIQNGF